MWKINNTVLTASIFSILLSLSHNLAYADQQKADFAHDFVTVEENLNTMDKDRDGIVTVYEVRSYIESIHGKNYKKDVMDDMEASANGKSCSTPFAKSLYQ